MTERRRALVTGAARGIGAAIVRAPARRTASRSSRSTCATGCDLRLDVARDEFPDLGDIDVCVANAGLTRTIAPSHRMTPEQWQQDIDVNLTGCFRTIQACLGGMRERRYGRIVVISSAAAVGGLPGQVAYAASKAGQLGLVQDDRGRERGASGSPPTPSSPASWRPSRYLRCPRRCASGCSRALPSGRPVEPAEIAAAVAFLAREEAAQITGQSIVIDGAASLTQLSLGSSER